MHTPKISQRFASKWKFGLWCCNLNEYYALAIYQLWFHYFLAFSFEAFGIHLSWQTKKWYSSTIPLNFLSRIQEWSQLSANLLVFFQVSTQLDTPLSTNVVLLHSMPYHFKSHFVFTSSLFGFHFYVAAATFVNVKTSLPKSIIPHVSVGVAPTEFNKSSKYLLQRKRISFSFLMMLPVESLMEVVVLELFPRKRGMVCRNSLLANGLNLIFLQTPWLTTQLFVYLRLWLP